MLMKILIFENSYLSSNCFIFYRFISDKFADISCTPCCKNRTEIHVLGFCNTSCFEFFVVFHNQIPQTLYSIETKHFPFCVFFLLLVMKYLVSKNMTKKECSKIASNIYIYVKIITISDRNLSK